ncbi:MAG: hypothetical protein WD335_03260 [Candidatus Paceibacterota bacterium]
MNYFISTFILLFTALYAHADQVPESEFAGASSVTKWIILGAVSLVLLLLVGGYYYHHPGSGSEGEDEYARSFDEYSQ